MKKLLFAIVAASSFALVGCGSAADLCNSKSKCSAQPAPTQAEIDTCKAAVLSTAKCSAEYTTLGNCSRSKEVCGADNKTDALATVAACATEAAAYATCLAK